VRGFTVTKEGNIKNTFLQAIKNPAIRAGFWTSIALVIDYGVVAVPFFLILLYNLLIFREFHIHVYISLFATS